jgi:hypothetical protein
MSSEVAGKTCCRCAIDVSSSKRHKDAKGRYWCEACFAKASAARERAATGTASGAVAGETAGGAGAVAEAATAGAAESATPSWLAGSLAIEGKRCPSCSSPMPKTGVICTMCGHNAETGKAVSTHVLAAPKEKPEKEGGGSDVLGSVGATLQGPAAIMFSAVGGLIGGGIGAFIWATIVKSMGVEVGYVAWLVGGLTGGGVAVVAGGYKGVITGCIAAVISIAAVFGGRYWAISSITEKIVAKYAQSELKVPEEMVPDFMAVDVVREWAAAGKTVNWPSAEAEATAESIADYPPEVQKEVTERWAAMSSTRKAAYIQDLQRRVNSAVTKMGTSEVFAKSFDMIDALFAIIAIATAYGVASGGSFGD